MQALYQATTEILEVKKVILFQYFKGVDRVNTIAAETFETQAEHFLQLVLFGENT